uniref:Uncharacterized protein n=2 Tax=Cacopsylla melanoneura TaxID=428564 RepID=A0A8D8VM95_9HEMI
MSPRHATTQKSEKNYCPKICLMAMTTWQNKLPMANLMTRTRTKWSWRRIKFTSGAFVDTVKHSLSVMELTINPASRSSSKKNQSKSKLRKPKNIGSATVKLPNIGHSVMEHIGLKKFNPNFKLKYLHNEHW